MYIYIYTHHSQLRLSLPSKNQCLGEHRPTVSHAHTRNGKTSILGKIHHPSVSNEVYRSKRTYTSAPKFETSGHSVDGSETFAPVAIKTLSYLNWCIISSNHQNVLKRDFSFLFRVICWSTFLVGHASKVHHFHPQACS